MQMRPASSRLNPLFRCIERFLVPQARTRCHLGATGRPLPRSRFPWCKVTSVTSSPLETEEALDGAFRRTMGKTRIWGLSLLATVFLACGGGVAEPEPQASEAPPTDTVVGETPYCQGNGGCATTYTGCCHNWQPDPYYCWARWHVHKEYRCCTAVQYAYCTANQQCCHGSCINHKCYQ
jgi:hypothetical protein